MTEQEFNRSDVLDLGFVLFDEYHPDFEDGQAWATWMPNGDLILAGRGGTGLCIPPALWERLVQFVEEHK